MSNMTEQKALTEGAANTTLDTLLLGGSSYTTPYVIEINDVVDSTTYEFYINSTLISVTTSATFLADNPSVSGTEPVEALLTEIKDEIDAETSLGVSTTLFDSEEAVNDPPLDEAKRLRIAQDTLNDPFVISGLQGPLGANQYVYVALLSEQPNESVVELTEAGYHRVKAVFDEADQRKAVIAEDAMFGAAEEDWGEITHYAIFDQLEGGTKLVQGIISVPKNVLENDYYVFREGNLTITLN